MYAGRLVEVDPAAELYRGPKHPYTQALRDSFPPLHAPLTELHGLPGSPPDLRQPAKGCRFAPRCPRAYDACRHDDPQPITIGTTEVSCLLHSGAAE